MKWLEWGWCRRWAGLGLRNLGQKVAQFPLTTILACLAMAIFCSAGMIWGRRELDPLKLWVPKDSRFALDTAWLLDRFGAAIRPQYLLATAPNVLDPEVLTQLAHVHNAVLSTGSDSFKYEDVCLRIPVITFNRRTKRSDFDDDFFEEDFFQENSTVVGNFDPSVDLDPSLYCSILESFPMACYHRSILELWNFDPETISKFTREEIADRINGTEVGPVFGHPTDYVSTLGGIKRDARGKVVSAESVLLTWFVHVNVSSLDTSLHGNDAGTEVWASESALVWEKSFLDVMKNASFNSSIFDMYYEAGRTFGDLSNDSMFQDMGKLLIGIALMFFYIQLILSKFNWVELKFTLGSVGLLCVGLALVTSCGICSFVGIPFGPVHSSLPFLLMGLGIDDMFVMKACWEQLTDYERSLPMSEQVGLMLEHAGTSIIVTSFTDIIAFLVGAITILPSLQSFCIYAALGVFFIFVYAVTFYVAIFVLDLKRMEEKRNGAVICIKHPNFVPTDHDDIPISKFILDRVYSKFVFTLPVKIIIILITVIVTGFSIEAILHLEQKFDPKWFIPEDSYFSKFVAVRDRYYPDMGYEATVFLGALNYSQELPKIILMIEKLENETNSVHKFDTFTTPFRSYVLSNFHKDIREVEISDLEWNTYISKFLYSYSGAKYQNKFRFNGNLKCGHPAPPVTVSSIDLRFKIFSSSAVYLPVMHRLQGIVQNANFTTGDKFATLWARVFSNWITDEIIQLEVERNLELALGCVMLCTLIIIGNIQICFWIFICVLLTLINTCGWMQKMGLTIDIISCVGLELGIGFCVDYAAHIGHQFLTVQGSRQSRALITVTSIGAAVLYGGGSTLLSISVLSMSEAYVFKTFFKIFLLVIVFGLFNGLLFLPVVLSFIGPQPHKITGDAKSKSKNYNVEEDAIELPEIINLNSIENI